MTRRACRRVVACFLFVCCYFVGIYPGAADSNQRSHYQLLRAMAERGTARIEPELADFGSHTDVAEHAGRRYSDKAPGLSAAAVPAYRVARLVVPQPSSTYDWLAFYVARLGSVTVVVAVALVVFVRQALRTSTRSRLLPLWLFALLFATPFQVYARSFFTHAFVAALLFLSFVLLSQFESVRAAVGSGLLAGAAVASEYPVIVIAICLLALAITKSRPRLVGFVAGAAVPALLLAWYHAHNFGGVLAFPSAANETYPILSQRGVSGVSWPRAIGVLGLFFEPCHGLLYFSPFLALWPIAAVRALRRVGRDASLLVPALGPLFLVVLISGFLPPHWRGGWCLGPRYVVAGFLLVFWLLAVKTPGSIRSPASVLLLGSIVYGAVVLAVCGSTYWLIPYESWNPARVVSAYYLKRGIVEFNLGLAAGLPPLASLLPPLAASGFALASAVRAAGLPARRLAAGALTGVLAAAAVAAIPASPAAVANSHREGLASVLLPSMRARWR